jgi:RimJ/RimL family protein N-acetyltransferase
VSGEIIRAARAEDAAAIAAVHVAAWLAAYRGIVPDEVLDELSTAERERRWRGWLGAPGEGWLTLVAEIGGRIVGFCTLVAPSRDPDAGAGTAEIAALYVVPEQWRRGTGKALLSAALDEARGPGLKDVVLWVLAGNAEAQEFYSRLGWSADGGRRFNDLCRAPEIRMRLHRAPLAERAVG